MINEQKIEQIRKKIQSSSLLSDHEKADWLNLLELMNDKQLGELEEILANEKPAEPAPASLPPVASPALAAALRPQMPDKPAIAPIGSGSSRPTAPKPAAPKPAAPKPAATSAPFKPSPPKPAVAPPEPMPQPIPQSLPQLGHIANVPAGIAVAMPPASTSDTGAAEPPIPKARLAASPPPDDRPKLAFQLSHPEDLQSLSIETLRKYAHESIVAAVKTSISEHGYFPILELIESSPLYDSYIASGKSLLSAQSTSENNTARSNNPDRLTQEELEFMTDLLSNMRFNRL